METNRNITNNKIHSMIHNLSCLSDLGIIISSLSPTMTDCVPLPWDTAIQSAYLALLVYYAMYPKPSPPYLHSVLSHLSSYNQYFNSTFRIFRIRFLHFL